MTNYDNLITQLEGLQLNFGEFVKASRPKGGIHIGTHRQMISTFDHQLNEALNEAKRLDLEQEGELEAMAEDLEESERGRDADL